MASGTVKWFNEVKGFGFIHGSDGQRDVFVHHSAIEADGYRTLREGEQVEYEENRGPRGLFATRVIKAQS